MVLYTASLPILSKILNKVLKDHQGLFISYLSTHLLQLCNYSKSLRKVFRFNIFSASLLPLKYTKGSVQHTLSKITFFFFLTDPLYPEILRDRSIPLKLGSILCKDHCQRACNGLALRCKSKWPLRECMIYSSGE